MVRLKGKVQLVVETVWAVGLDKGTRRVWPLILGLGLLIPLAYLSYAMLSLGELSLHSDDAWIYQVYARNLARLGELSFNPGEPSAGTTGVLWSLLLTIGYLIPSSPFVPWTYALGIGFFLLAAYAAYLLSSALFPSSRLAPIATAFLCIANWQFVWGALSGMETMLTTSLVLLALYTLVRYPGQRPWLVGLLAGLAFLSHPEGIPLFGVSFLVFSLLGGTLVLRLRNLTVLTLSFLAPSVPGALHNLLSGTGVLPTPIYARGNVDFLGSFQFYPLYGLQVVYAVFGGALMLLAPFLIMAGVEIVRRRQWLRGVPFLWGLASIGGYWIVLPFLNYDVRYETPWLYVAAAYGSGTAIPILCRHWRRPIARVYAALIVLTCAGFLSMYAGMFAGVLKNTDDVHFSALRFLEATAPAGTRVATYDIGVLGYYGDFYIVDLAGLVTPEAIPYAKANRFLDFVESERASYVAIFPGRNQALMPMIEQVAEKGGKIAFVNDDKSAIVLQLGP